MPFLRDTLDKAVAAAGPRAVKAMAKAAAAIEKAAPNARATTTDLTSQAQAIAAQGTVRGSNFDVVPLPREAQAGAFGPGTAFTPSGIDPRLPGRDRPAPRVAQFPVSVNLNLNDRLVPFSTLRDVADHVDVIRRCIEVRKAHLTSLSWDVVISGSTIEAVMADENVGPGRASQIARDKYQQAIADAAGFWQRPDRLNGLDFGSWLAMLLEEQLVIDALSIYPHMTLGGELHSFEILDGATIKPLLDGRGAVPQPPSPAYQQILWGFPRGEFTASTDDLAAEYLADRLVYRPRNRRTWTPYGYSQVEQALSFADLYLKRMAWVRSEFADGVMPAAIIESDADMTPEQRASYEQHLNDELSGQTAERHRFTLLPKGFKVAKGSEFAERYQSDYDEFLIKCMCMCFDVMPTEIGFPPKGGLGGKGHQEGEESTTYRKQMRPDVLWLSGIINELSWNYLGMPREIEFSFLGYEVEDQMQVEQQWDLITKGGRGTINQYLAQAGRPMWDFPEADTPFIVTGAGIQFLKGAMEAAATAHEGPGGNPGPHPDIAQDGAGVSDGPGEAVASPLTPIEPVPADAAVGEGRKFLVYATKKIRKAAGWRDFTFDHITPTVAAEWNSLGQSGDLDALRLAVKRRVNAAERLAKLGEKLGPKLKSATIAAVPVDELASEWERLRTASKDATPTFTNADADTLKAQATGLVSALVAKHKSADAIEAAISDLYSEAFDAGVVDMNDVFDEGVDVEPLDMSDDIAAASKGWVERIAGNLATGLVRSPDSAAEAVAGVLAGITFATAASSLAAGPYMTGKTHTAKTAGVERVQLVSDGGCEFCDSYDGRILDVDNDTSGMPPLHNGCACDIEPLDSTGPDSTDTGD
jgi:hypothetical protein